MKIEEMTSLIRQEWSDAMSDNGAIWKATYAKLQKAKTEYPSLFEQALPIARELGR
jgi:hypothetical protein